jgi:hypothetical protein
MLNEHIAELYDRARIGTAVRMLAAGGSPDIVQTSGS